ARVRRSVGHDRGRGRAGEDVPRRRRRRVRRREGLHQHRLAGRARAARQARGGRADEPGAPRRRRVHDRSRVVHRARMTSQAAPSPTAAPTPEPVRDEPSRAIRVALPRELAPYARTQLRWRTGCEVTVLRAGEETYPAMLSAIASAEESILLETYKIGRAHV